MRGSFYKLRLNRRDSRRLLRAKWIIIIFALLGVAAVIWLAWVRPAQREQQINSFDQCKAAGYPIQESYPEVCLTHGGKRFVNPEQDAAHQASLRQEEELVPPANPALLYLDIEEWGVRIPLTEKTFDLAYNYIEDGFSERIYFSYKRLVKARLCQTDIGLNLTRQGGLHEAPFTKDKPAPTAHVGMHYFYVFYQDDKPCYRADDKAQAALVKEITGGKTLPETTVELLKNLKAMPKI